MAEFDDLKSTPTYNSLEDISAQKEKILSKIREDDMEMKSMWNGIFHRPSTPSSVLPSRRINTLVKTGAGVFDVVLVAWKLYRKFKKKRLF